MPEFLGLQAVAPLNSREFSYINRLARSEHQTIPPLGPGPGTAHPAQDANRGDARWNILCRWAFCLSLRQPASPTPIDIPSDSNVEMTWQVFGGEAQEVYLALLKERCVLDGLGTADEVLLRQSPLALAPRH